MSTPADQFGNLGSSTDFLNTNALGLNSGTTTTDALGQPTNQLGTADNALGPVNDFGATAGPAPVSSQVGIGGTGAGGAPSTGAASSSGSTGTDWSSIFGNLGNDINSFLNSPLGSLAEFTGLYKIIANQAGKTEAQNTALAKQISDIGQPDVTAGKNMLDAYTSGNLTAPFQAQLEAAKAQDAKTATSQEQQVASMLANAGGQNMQSGQVSQTGQIEAQKNLADTTAMSNAFLAELSASLNLTQTGGAFVQSGIMQEIQSNTQLQAQLADLMGALAKAYATQTAQSGKGGSSGSAGGLINDVGNLWKGVTNLFGSGSTAGGIAGYNDVFGTSAAAAAQPAGTYGSLGALGGTSSGLGVEGSFGAAGAGGTGIGAAGTAGADAAGAAGAGAAETAAAGGAGGAGVASAAGAAGAGAGVADAATAAGTGATAASAAAPAVASSLGAYSASPAVVEAMTAAIPDAAAPEAAAAVQAGTAAGSGATVGAAGSAMAIAAPIAFIAGLYMAISSDKANSTPMAQMQVLAQNGPIGAALAQSMIATASKYGDPNSAAAWNIANWSAADRAAVNNGKATDPLRSKGLGGNRVTGGHRYDDINANA